MKTRKLESASPAEASHLALSTLLMLIACAIPVRPFFLANTKSDESLLYDLAFNFMAWIVVIILYKYISKHSLKQWWIIVSGSLSWLSLLVVFNLTHTLQFTKATWIFAEEHERFKAIILYFPSLCSVIALLFALRSKGTRKLFLYLTSLSIILATAPPLLWIYGYIFYYIFHRKFLY